MVVRHFPAVRRNQSPLPGDGHNHWKDRQEKDFRNKCHGPDVGIADASRLWQQIRRWSIGRSEMRLSSLPELRARPRPSSSSSKDCLSSALNSRTRTRTRTTRRRMKEASQGFTILEIMIAMFIFALVLTAIYSIWHGIIKGTASGLKAAAEVQRSRVSMRTIEQAFLSARVFQENIKWYYFIADTRGERSAISMTCRLPADFLGMGYIDPNLRMRRVDFFTRPGPDGTDELVLSHVPL